jgi:hypothetical protein
MKNFLMFLMIAMFAALPVFSQDAEPDVNSNTAADSSADELSADNPPAADLSADNPPAADLSVEAPTPAGSAPQQPPVPAEPPSAKPKIAVYVTGGRDAIENRALATYILDAVAASGKFTAIERSDAFLASIDDEHVKQRSGAIDDSQITALGKQSGVMFVCVADIVAALRGFQVSARVLDVETAEVVTVGVAQSPLKSMDDLRKASAGVVGAMLAKLYPDEYAAAVPEKRLKFGARAAYANSFATKKYVSVSEYDYDIDMRVTTDYYGDMGFAASGAEFSAVVQVGLTEDLWLCFSPGLVIRTPYISDAAKITELAILIPAMIEYKIMKSPFRVGLGLQADIPFNTKLAKEGESPEKLAARSAVDFGLLLGASYHITRNIAIDLRGSIGLRNFDEGNQSGPMNQAAFGVSWLY